MNVGAENPWRLNGIKIPSMRARTNMLTSFGSHRFNHHHHHRRPRPRPRRPRRPHQHHHHNLELI